VTALELERAGARAESVRVQVPLLERVPDPDVALAYLGDRSTDARVCTIARGYLRAHAVTGMIVVIAPEAPVAELPVALVRGLRADQERCLAEHGALAVLADPAAARGGGGTP
jgi:hypothetical protein